MAKDFKLEEIREKVLQTIDGMQAQSPFKSSEFSRVEYVYKVIDQIQQEGWTVVEDGKVVTDKFIRFLDTIAKDPINRTLIYRLIPCDREEFLTLKHPYKMKPSSLQSTTKYYYVSYILDNVIIAKMALTPKTERHYSIDFFEFDPKYSKVGYMPDIVKDSLTSEFGLTSFEFSPKVFGFLGV